MIGIYTQARVRAAAGVTRKLIGAYKREVDIMRVWLTTCAAPTYQRGNIEQL